MTAAGILARARAAIGTPVTYKLGQPGRVIPPKATTAPLPALCDCSGFAFYAMNRERFIVQDGLTMWFDTTAIDADARISQSYFVMCPPEPGCLIVYPDSKRSGRKKEGHIGIVSEIIVSRVTGDSRVTKVIHCASSHPKGRAVQETGPEVFVRNGAICVRWREAK